MKKAIMILFIASAVICLGTITVSAEEKEEVMEIQIVEYRETGTINKEGKKEIVTTTEEYNPDDIVIAPNPEITEYNEDSVVDYEEVPKTIEYDTDEFIGIQPDNIKESQVKTSNFPVYGILGIIVFLVIAMMVGLREK